MIWFIIKPQKKHILEHKKRPFDNEKGLLAYYSSTVSIIVSSPTSVISTGNLNAC